MVFVDRLQNQHCYLTGHLMGDFVSEYLRRKKAPALFRRLNGWFLPSHKRTISIGLLPSKTRPCIYLTDDQTGKIEILGVLRSKETAKKARIILTELAEGVEQGSLK